MAQQNVPPSSAKRPVPPAPIAQKTPNPQPNMRPAPRKSVNTSSVPFWFGLLVSIMWVGVVILIVAKSGPAHTFGGLPLVNWAIGISAIASPVALVWMVTAYLQRAADIQTIAEPLRRQLALITGESGVAETRIRRFNQAMKEQLDLLKSVQVSGREDITQVMERVNLQRVELERFESASVQQVKDIQDIIRRNMQQVEQLMDDKFTMMRVLDDKFVQSGDGVARQADAVREQISSLLDNVEANADRLVDALSRAMQDSKKLADTSQAQEESLVAAAENAAEILGGVSSKIDLSVARFLERAGTAREEADRLANTLDAQTRSLDEFSTTLPARVSETENILRGVADRLYASEQLAREQADRLTEKLSAQLDGLNLFVDRFVTKMTDIDGSLEGRRAGFDQLLDRIVNTAGGFASNWEKQVVELDDRTNETLQRFVIANEDTRKGADAMSAHLAETAARYEDAVQKMKSLTTESHEELRGITEQVTSHLAQFEALREASHKASVEVEARAATAMQNLQYVLERLLTARDATQGIGEKLVKDLFDAVDQNETLISRLNEAAQMSVRALGIATDSLGKKENDLIGQTRAAEQVFGEIVAELQKKSEMAADALRGQTREFTQLLAEAQGEMEKTDGRLQSFVASSVPPIEEAIRRVDQSADNGLQSLSRYGEGLQEQLMRLQGFHDRVGGMGGELSRITADTLGSIEQLQARFAAARAIQDESARQALMQFADLSDRLQREVTGLDGQAGKAVETLREAAAGVGEQSYQMLQTAEASGAKMQMITTALQAEAAQIRSVLQKQADDLAADLSRAEKQFATLGDAIQQRTDAAYSLLDRVATHYNESTRAASQDMDARTERLQLVVGEAQGKVEGLNVSLNQQLADLAAGTTQIEANAANIATAGTKAMQQISAVNEKLSMTHDQANRNAQQTIQRIEECNTAFMRQTDGLSEAAQNSVGMVQKAGIAFGEQASRMVDTTQQIDLAIRQITATTNAMVEQQAHIRTGMEQHNQRLVAQLTEAIALLEGSSNKLQHSASSAAISADQASTRFADVTDKASMRLDGSREELEGVAARAEAVLSSIGANITQQASSLSVLGDQLAEQQRILASTGETQRQQLVELFDRLGTAHAQASEVADRTIARLTDALADIQRQLGNLSDQSQTTVGNVRAATTGFSEQASALVQNAQAAEQQARTVLSVTAALQEQARQLRDALNGESDRASERLTTLINKISAGGVELRDLTANTEMSLASLDNNLAQQAQGLSMTMQQISERQRTLTTALDAQRDVMNGLLSRMNLAQDELASTAERTVVRLSDGAQQMVRQVESLDGQAKSALANIEAANSNFAQEANVMNAHAREAEAQARSILTATTGLQEQARSLRLSVQEESERAGEILTTLVNKLLYSGNQVRDIATVTETSLQGLHSGLMQQASEVQSSMQQIAERQKGLSSGLSEQRDMLGTLLNRVAVAQDETAAAAERSVVRLADGAQQIVRQMEAIDQQAQSTLSNVQAVGRTFADEAGNLGVQAQQAEQHMRGVVTVMGGLQDQAERVRNDMQAETSRMIGELNSVIAQLEVTNTALKQQSATAMHAMDQSALQFAGLAKISAEALQEQSAALSTTAEKSEERIMAVGERVKEQIRWVAEVAGDAEAETRKIADAAEYATSRLGSLRSSMIDGDREGQAILNQITMRIDEVKAGLQAEVARLVDVSRNATEQVTTASQKLSEESDILRANLAASESALSNAATLVRDESVQVPNILSRSAVQFEEAARHLREHAADADQTLIGTADRFISVTMTARESLVDEMRRISTVADNADKVLRTFTVELASQVGSMQHSAEKLSVEQRGLVETSGSSVAQLQAASERLSKLHNGAAETAEKLAREFGAIDVHTTATTERLEKASAAVTKNVEALAQVAQVAEGQMMGATSGMREQLERIRQGLQGQIDDINRGLMQITAQLERTGNTLRSTTAGTVADVERISQRFADTSKDASTHLTEKTERMRGMTEEVAKLLSGFGDQFDVLLDRLSMAGDGIKRQEGSLITQLQSVLNYLGAVAEKLETGRTLASEVSDVTVARLTEVVNVVEGQIKSLASNSQTAAGVMRGVGQIYGEQAQSMNRNMGDVHNQVVTINKSIDDMQQRTDRMRVALKLQGEDLMQSLQQILAQLSMTGDTLSETVDQVLQERAAEGLKKIS